ncbi:MAG TPA: TolC family protein [Terriglobales bacterium]
MNQLWSVSTTIACVAALGLAATAQAPASAPKSSVMTAKACFAEPASCVRSAESSPVEDPPAPRPESHAEESLAGASAVGRPLAINQQSPPSTQAASVKLTISDAEQLALKNHPRISIGELNALAAKQTAREVRAAFLPVVSMNGTTVTTLNEGNRLTAGFLNNPSVFDRAAAGLAGEQLITDFGRTKNLYTAANLNAQAQAQTARATREQIVFTVDQAFFDALSSDVLVKVAEQTVEARQVVTNQIQALENAKLRSALDLSFANVALAQAQLLLVNANNNRGVAYAILSEAMGLPSEKAFELVDTAPSQPPLRDIDTIIQEALDNRPDLKALELQQNAAEHLATAEARLQLPDVNMIGATGVTPVANSHLGTNGYGAVGVNIHIPVFNGFLFTARAAEARFRAQAAEESVRDLKDRVARDVRQAWLNVNSAFERENVAAILLEQATLSLNLAQARYRLGLGSIVELSQAQLQQTEAEIGTVTAKYQYEFSLSALAYQLGGNTP